MSLMSAVVVKLQRTQKKTLSNPDAAPCPETKRLSPPLVELLLLSEARSFGIEDKLKEAQSHVIHSRLLLLVLQAPLLATRVLSSTLNALQKTKRKPKPMLHTAAAMAR
jgi:hypothetical protein